MQGGSSPHACRAGWDKAGKEASSNIGRYQSYQADYGESLARIVEYHRMFIESKSCTGLERPFSKASRRPGNIWKSERTYVEILDASLQESPRPGLH